MANDDASMFLVLSWDYNIDEAELSGVDAHELSAQLISPVPTYYLGKKMNISVKKWLVSKTYFPYIPK